MPTKPVQGKIDSGPKENTFHDTSSGEEDAFVNAFLYFKTKKKEEIIMSQKQILTIVVSLVCAGIAFAEIQNIRYAKQIDTPTTIHPIRLIACIGIVLMGIYSLVTGNYILNV